MQEIEFSGFFRHVIDVVSIFLVLTKMFLQKQLFKLLFETHPACVSKMFLHF